MSEHKQNTKKGIIKVSNLPFAIEEEQLKKWLSQFGEISKVVLSRSLKTGRTKGHAYVEFKNSEVAKLVVEKIKTYFINNQLVKLRYIAERDNKNAKIFKSPSNKIKKPNIYLRAQKLLDKYRTIIVDEAQNIDEVNKYTVDVGRELLQKTGIEVDYNILTSI